MEKFTEILLGFEFSSDEDDVKKANILCDLLEENNIDYVGYDIGTGWQPSFLIRRRKGFTWNDIMKLVNSIRSPRYYKKKYTFCLTENNFKGIRGNIMKVNC